jgi:hypothetical protein
MHSREHAELLLRKAEQDEFVVEPKVKVGSLCEQ